MRPCRKALNIAVRQPSVRLVRSHGGAWSTVSPHWQRIDVDRPCRIPALCRQGEWQVGPVIKADSLYFRASYKSWVYEASKSNGSVSLLSLNRIRLFDRIEFQHSLMQSNFQHFYDAIRALGAFANRFENSDNAMRSKLPQPILSELSPAELVEYRTLLSTAIQYSQFYASQLRNLTVSYNLVLHGTKDVETLIEATDASQRAR